MQAVKAMYKHGNIELLTPIKGVEEAELFIVVLDKNDDIETSTKKFRAIENTSEEDFRAIGLSSYFDTDEDKDVDWENFFNVKTR